MPELAMILKLLGGGAALLGSLVWLTRTILAHLLSKDLEVFKARLNAESGVALEQLKSQMGLLAAERAVRFSALHEKRADVVADLYYRLSMLKIRASLLQRLQTLRQAGTVTEARVDDFVSELAVESTSLFQHIMRNQLYFGPELANALRDASFLVGVEVLTVSDDAKETRRAKFVQTWSTAEPEMAALLHAIESQFRRILGSDAESLPTVHSVAAV
jgi:hypothetical protein